MNRLLATVMLCFIRHKNGRADFIRKHKLFHHMGENCGYQPRKIPSEPYLVSIHDNVQITANVSLVTHDVICDVFNHSKEFAKTDYKYYMGTIEIFDNVFVGMNSTILPNVKIGPNAIVAAGSVVTGDVPAGTIVGGNPAKVIGSYYELEEKYRNLPEEMPDDHCDRKTIDAFYWAEDRERREKE